MEFSRSNLESAGFSGFVPIRDLKKDGCKVIPAQMGVYVLLRTTSEPPLILPRSIGGHFKGIDPTVGVSELEHKWVPNASVVYIGKAGGLNSGATLRSRLNQYVDFGKGKPVGHRGGRYVWQLGDCDELLIAWKPLADKDPRSVERDMITRFVANYGKTPFANIAR